MFRTLSAEAAIKLDQDLMSTSGFSIDQLMELAGLAVAKAIYSQYPPSQDTNPANAAPPGQGKVLVLVGPGNNGGDGLVCARHLKLWKYHEPVVYYPKRPSKELFTGLTKQLDDLGVARIDTLQEVKELLSDKQLRVVVDALFGFSFKLPIREPFAELLHHLASSSATTAPIVSVDVPSGWDVEQGPVDVDIQLSMLVSLSAPKSCARMFPSHKPHYLGGRFISDAVAEKYGIRDLVLKYKADEIITRLSP